MIKDRDRYYRVLGRVECILNQEMAPDILSEEEMEDFIELKHNLQRMRRDFNHE